MIQKWHLNNFKSVLRADLELAPLTLFAGANSSGKSTLLQSILLISQTLASRVATQTILLNGHFTKLGQLDDLHPSSSESGNIEIGWEVRVQESQPEFGLQYRSAPHLETVSGEINFGPSPIPSDKAAQLNPVLIDCTISCVVAGQDGKSPKQAFIRLKRKPNTPKQSPELVDAEQGRMSTLSSDFIVSMDEEAQEYLRDDIAGATPVGVALQHFLPIVLLVAFNKTDEIIKAIVSAVTDPRSARQGARHIEPGEVVLPQEMVILLKEKAPDLITPLVSRLAQKSVDPTHIKMTLSDLIEHARMRPFRSKQTYQAISSEITNVGKRTLQKEPAMTSVGLPGRILDTAVMQTASFFSRSIRYLGPLRDEPRSLYPLHTTADPLDVGLHGEHTAAVFHNYQRTAVRYIASAHFSNAEQEKPSSAVALRNAVFDWLAYLDVASKVDTRDEGKLGHGLSVFIDEAKEAHDLPHVGVGVSQVFPIVVMCLLAAPGTTVIIEQPELHLNPKVQTRLADFFLSMALLGKQCLIETHSEYLINRLRLRSALAHSDSLSSLMKLYFVEKIKGITQYRSVKINEYGAIVDWPVGFFDQSQREIENILLAASEKVAKKA